MLKQYINFLNTKNIHKAGITDKLAGFLLNDDRLEILEYRCSSTDHCWSAAIPNGCTEYFILWSCNANPFLACNINGSISFWKGYHDFDGCDFISKSEQGLLCRLMTDVIDDEWQECESFPNDFPLSEIQRASNLIGFLYLDEILQIYHELEGESSRVECDSKLKKLITKIDAQ